MEHVIDSRRTLQDDRLLINGGGGGVFTGTNTVRCCRYCYRVELDATTAHFVWLSARERMIAVHPMTQMLEEATFSANVAKDLGVPGPVQFLLRASYVERYPEPVSLRRPVAAMLVDKIEGQTAS